VRYRVVGSVRPELVEDGTGAAHHRLVESTVSRILTFGLSLPKRFGRRQRPTFNALVKPELRREHDAPVEPGIVAPSSPR
jgi:hypothetical protein